uniref:Uncharacterized protein n=1 Tax=Brassica oleracea var. oleracea TaxID=109376 RepID=A0A0D3D2T0_BRAOL
MDHLFIRWMRLNPTVQGKEANEINNILRRSPRSEEAMVWRWQKKLQVVVEVEPRKKKKKIGGEGEKTET